MTSSTMCDHPACTPLVMSGYGRGGYYNMGYRYCTTCRYYTLESLDNCPGCGVPYRLESIYEPEAKDVRFQRGSETVAIIQ